MIEVCLSDIPVVICRSGYRDRIGIALTGEHSRRRPAIAQDNRHRIRTVRIPQRREMDMPVIAVLPEDPLAGRELKGSAIIRGLLILKLREQRDGVLRIGIR